MAERTRIIPATSDEWRIVTTARTTRATLLAALITVAAALWLAAHALAPTAAA